MTPSDLNDEDIRVVMYRLAERRTLPDDAEKDDADWLELRIRSDWQEQAFSAHVHAAVKYLKGMFGDQYSSRDIHMFCQGAQLAVEAAVPPEKSLTDEELFKAWAESEGMDDALADELERRGLDL